MSESHLKPGPLQGLKIIEIAGIGPGPFCGMLLSDMGAEVVRVERPPSDDQQTAPVDPMLRGRPSIVLDLKRAECVAALLRMVEQADAIFEGFRPGVAERLGFGPDTCLQRNPGIIYGRMTGWGQEGPLAGTAGHDINYIALTGVLHAIGQPGGKPIPPVNLVGDFGGGGLMLAFGLVCALLEAQKSGIGQVVDAAVVDGALMQMALSFGMLAQGQFPRAPGSSLLAGAAPFYDCYETADGKYVAIGALEPAFFAQLLELTGISSEAHLEAGLKSLQAPADMTRWPALRAILEQTIGSKTRDQWCDLLEGSDACLAPVLSLSEVHAHPHHIARAATIEIDGVRQNAPAPRFSRTPAATPTAPRPAGADTREVLTQWGFTSGEIDSLS